MKKGWKVAKETISEFSEDNVLRLSAALAYYSIFSLGPLLIIIVGVAGLVLSETSVRHHIQDQLQSFLGPQSAKVVESMMTTRSKSTGLGPTIIGIITLLFGASGVFGQLQDALNTIWEVKSKPGKGLLAFLRHRFLSFGMVLVIGFLLLISMVLTTALSAMTGTLGGYLPMSEVLAHGLNLGVSFLVITLLFGLIFKVLPDVKVGWGDVWVGAIGTALLFTLGKFLLGLYLGRESTTSAYGAAGSVVLILLWVYYASIILFLGAEFTQVYAKARGHRVVPTEFAVPVTQTEREEQGMPKEPKQRESAAPEREAAPAGRPAVEPAFSQTAHDDEAVHAEAIHPVPFKPMQEHPWRFASLAMSLGVALGAIYQLGIYKMVKRAKKAAHSS